MKNSHFDKHLVASNMVRDCRLAILDGKEAFRGQMKTMLKQICKPKYDRARLYKVYRKPILDRDYS